MTRVQKVRRMCLWRKWPEAQSSEVWRGSFFCIWVKLMSKFFKNKECTELKSSSFFPGLPMVYRVIGNLKTIVSSPRNLRGEPKSLSVSRNVPKHQVVGAMEYSCLGAFVKVVSTMLTPNTVRRKRHPQMLDGTRPPLQVRASFLCLVNWCPILALQEA